MNRTLNRHQARKGDFVVTAGGRLFWPLDPRPDEIDIADIAHALTNLCRWTGHVRRFWSVAAHSLLVASLVPEEFQLEALLHDASEAYLGDVVRPLKYQPELAGYRDAERPLQDMIQACYGLPPGMSDVVQRADNTALVMEARDLITDAPAMDWYQDYLRDYPPPAYRLRPWHGWAARHRFLQRFEELTVWRGF